MNRFCSSRLRSLNAWTATRIMNNGNIEMNFTSYAGRESVVGCVLGLAHALVRIASRFADAVFQIACRGIVRVALVVQP